MRIQSVALMAALPLLAAVAFANASDAAIGRWKTIDDETGKVKSIVEITQAGNGTLSGQVVEILHSDRGPNPVCDKCGGANKDKPIKGMVILWGLQPRDGGWAGGTILDPAKGKPYKAKVKWIDANKLGVSGCIAFICREQEWIRE